MSGGNILARPLPTSTPSRSSKVTRWPKKSDSHLAKKDDPAKWDSCSESGTRTYLKCVLASKVGHTSSGGGEVYSQYNTPTKESTIDVLYPSTQCPCISHTGKALKPPAGAVNSMLLIMPIEARELYRRLTSRGVRLRYKKFLEVCVYLHNQWFKAKQQDLGGFFETSADEAKCFVKELSVNGKRTALPALLDDIGITTKKPGYIKGEQAIRRAFNGNSIDCFELLPCSPKWVDNIERKLKKLFDSYLERQELVHIKDSYNALSFLDSDLDEIESRHTRSKKSKQWGYHYSGYAESVRSGEPWRFSPSGNRVHAYVRFFPSDFRIRGFFDYRDSIERVCSADLKSSHPTMLVKVLGDYLSKRRNGPESVENALLELEEYASLVHSGELYESIQGTEKRKDSKAKFQRWLNGERWYYPEVDDWFERRFRELFCIIRAFKNNDSFVPIHSHLRRIEAAVVIQAIKFCADQNIPAVPIIDEIMVPESEGEKVAQQLLVLLYQQFGLKAVVSVDYHDPDAEGLAREEVFRYQELSVQNEVLTPCPDGYCPDCWDNNCSYFLDSPFPCKHVKPMR